MKCAICNKEDEVVTHYVTDCRECQAIIRDTIAGYENLDTEEPDEEDAPYVWRDH